MTIEEDVCTCDDRSYDRCGWCRRRPIEVSSATGKAAEPRTSAATTVVMAPAEVRCPECHPGQTVVHRPHCALLNKGEARPGKHAEAIRICRETRAGYERIEAWPSVAAIDACLIALGRDESTPCASNAAESLKTCAGDE